VCRTSAPHRRHAHAARLGRATEHQALLRLARRVPGHDPHRVGPPGIWPDICHENRGDRGGARPAHRGPRRGAHHGRHRYTPGCSRRSTRPAAPRGAAGSPRGRRTSSGPCPSPTVRVLSQIVTLAADLGVHLRHRDRPLEGPQGVLILVIEQARSAPRGGLVAGATGLSSGPWHERARACRRRGHHPGASATRRRCRCRDRRASRTALVAAALAGGPSVLEGVLFADDTEAMLDSLARLGVELEVDGRPTVAGRRWRGRLGPGRSRSTHACRAPPPGSCCRCWRSAPGLPPRRGRAAAPGPCATGSRTRRPGRQVAEHGQPGHLRSRSVGRPPARPATPLERGCWRARSGCRGDVSSQFLSGLVLSALLPRGLVVRVEGPLVSRPTWT
jgi:hypothetical protein